MSELPIICLLILDPEILQLMSPRMADFFLRNAAILEQAMRFFDFSNVYCLLAGNESQCLSIVVGENLLQVCIPLCMLTGGHNGCQGHV